MCVCVCIIFNNVSFLKNKFALSLAKQFIYMKNTFMGKDFLDT